MRHPLRLIVPVCAAWSLACMGAARRTSETEYHRVVTQDALVPAARAPAAVGPLAPPGRVTLEADGVGAYYRLPTRTLDEGGPGQWTAGDWLGGRIGIGVTDSLEFGLAADGSPTALANRASKGLDPVAADWLGRASLQVRFAPRVGERVRLLVSAETDFVSAPYERRETVASVTSYYDGTSAPPQITSDEWGSTERSSRFQWVGRVGVGVQGEIGRATVGGGLSMQSMPVFFGQDEVSWTCTSWDDGTQECDEPDATPAPYTATLVATVYGSASYAITDNVMILAEPWVDLPGSAQDAVLNAPGGALVAVRFTSPVRRVE